MLDINETFLQNKIILLKNKNLANVFLMGDQEPHVPELTSQ